MFRRKRIVAALAAAFALVAMPALAQHAARTSPSDGASLAAAAGKSGGKQTVYVSGRKAS